MACVASSRDAVRALHDALPLPVERSTHRRLALLAEPDPAARQWLASGIELTPEVTYASVRAVEHTGLLREVQKQLESQGLSGLPRALCFLAV